jgi:hypothetical protein
MPMQDRQRQEGLRIAGVSQQQIEEAIGSFPLDQGSIRALGLSRDDAEAVRDEVRQVAADAAIIAAKYNAIARRTNRNITAEVSEDEIAADRAHLEELLADEYRFLNPFGNIEGKRRTIDVILNGRILYSGYGSGGFESMEESLQVHGDTAILVSSFRMGGSGEARKVRTGEVYEQDLAGTYRTTHTYVRRDGRWQYATSQMTAIPEEREFVFVADEEADY